MIKILILWFLSLSNGLAYTKLECLQNWTVDNTIEAEMDHVGQIPQEIKVSMGQKLKSYFEANCLDHQERGRDESDFLSRACPDACDASVKGLQLEEQRAKDLNFECRKVCHLFESKVSSFGFGYRLAQGDCSKKEPPYKLDPKAKIRDEFLKRGFDRGRKDCK